MNSAVHCRPDSVNSSANCSKHNASGKSEATAEQQRVDSPRHWLKVPANNLAESKVAAKRNALPEELMGEDATKPMIIRGLKCPRMRTLDHSEHHC